MTRLLTARRATWAILLIVLAVSLGAPAIAAAQGDVADLERQARALFALTERLGIYTGIP